MTTNFSGRTAARLLAAVALCALSAPLAFAQEKETTVEDIVVTATKRESSLLNVPFSVAAVTQDAIRKSASANLEDVSRGVAGLSIQNLGPGQSQVAIRGVSAGQIVRDQPGVKEQVGVYLDESVISLSLFTPDLDLYDLKRVETLRGPQGTLFGSGSVGGTIRFITNQPDASKFYASAEASANLIDGGSAGGGVKGMINAPTGESSAIRAVGYYTRFGGFIDAVREGGSITPNVNKGERFGGRIAFTFKPTENMSVTPRIVYQQIRTNGFNREEVFNLLGNPYTTTRPKVTLGERQQFLELREKFTDKTLIADLNITVDFTGVQMTAISSYTNRKILVSRDASALTDSVSISLSFAPGDILLPSNLLDTTKVEQFTQEVRFASTGDGPLQWVGGAFYSYTGRKYAQRLPTPGYDAATDRRFGAGTSTAVANGYGKDSPYNADLPYDLKQIAAFGEVTYQPIEPFKLTVGGRAYSYNETRRFKSGGLFSDGNNQVDETSATGFTPRFLASYKVADTVTVNAQISRGFRLGGVNDPLNRPLCTADDLNIFGGYQKYQDEKLWNYEGGVKARAGIFTVNAAVFYTKISNLQVTLDAGSCSSRISFNVPKAHTVGTEFEVTARPLPGLDLGISGSVLESKFDSTVRDGSGNVLAGLEKGNRLASVPNFQLSANATYNFDLTDSIGAYVTASVQHVGSRYTQPSDQVNNPRSFVSNLPFAGSTGSEVTVVNLRLPSYQLVNLSAGLKLAHDVEVQAYVTNLTDTNAKLSFDRERGGRARLGFAVSQPRTFGITLRKDY